MDRLVADSRRTGPANNVYLVVSSWDWRAVKNENDWLPFFVDEHVAAPLQLVDRIRPSTSTIMALAASKKWSKPG